VNYQQDDWTDWLATVEFSYNDKKHAATGKTPLERRPYGSNRDTMGRRIHKTSAEELETHCTCNRRVSEKHEITV